MVEMVKEEDAVSLFSSTAKSFTIVCLSTRSLGVRPLQTTTETRDGDTVFLNVRIEIFNRNVPNVYFVNVAV